MKHRARPTVLSLRDMDFGSNFASNQSYDTKIISEYVDQYTKGCNPLYVCGNPESVRLSFSIELAKSICRLFPYRQSIPDYRRVHIIPYSGSIQESISELYIPGYILLPWEDNWGAAQKDHRYQRYCEKLQLLHDYSLNPGLFILDGVDGITLEEVERDPALSDLLKLGTVIIVSNDILSKQEYVIEFKPMGVSSSLEKCDFTHEELVVLQNASLLPPDGMNTRLFINSIGKMYRPVVQSLIDRGALPGEIRGKVFPPDKKYVGPDDDYLPFLTNVHQTPTNFRSYFPHTWNRACYILTKAANILADASGLYTYWAADLHRLRGDYTIAARLLDQFLSKQQTIDDPFSHMYSTALFEVANCQAFLGDNVHNENEQKLYFQKASMLLDTAISKQSSQEHLNLDLLSDIILMKAWLLKHEGDIRTADQLSKEVLQRQENVLGVNNGNLAQWYIKVASLYTSPGADIILRSEYTQKALDLLLTPESKNSHILADACILMESCVNQSDIDGRISWERRALSSPESNSPWCRHLIYQCHLHLAYLAECNRDPKMQENELRAAITILLEMLPANHPRIRLHAHSIVDLSKKTSSTNNNFSS